MITVYCITVNFLAIQIFLLKGETPYTNIMSDVINELNQIPNIAQFIATRIEQMILTGEIAPNSRLVQNEIADQFGVSRLPVRDAFAILHKKNLIKQLPRKGMVVRNIDKKEVDNLFEHRLLIEPYAIKKSLPHFDEKMIQEASDLIDQQSQIPEEDIIPLLDIDEAFHSHLWKCFENDEIIESLASVWRRIKVVRALARKIPNWKDKSVKGHRDILESIKEQDYNTAIKRLEKGIKRSQKEIIDNIEFNN